MTGATTYVGKRCRTTRAITGSLFSDLTAQLSLEQTGSQSYAQQLESSRFGNGCRRRGSYDAEKTIRLAIGACGEVKLVAASPIAVIADSQSPEAVNSEGAAIERQQLPDERIGKEIESVDAYIAEIAD